MTDIKLFVSLIPIGSENAIKRNDLTDACVLNGLIKDTCKDKDRKMRIMLGLKIVFFQSAVVVITFLLMRNMKTSKHTGIRKSNVQNQHLYQLSMMASYMKITQEEG